MKKIMPLLLIVLLSCSTKTITQIEWIEVPKQYLKCKAFDSFSPSEEAKKEAQREWEYLVNYINEMYDSGSIVEMEPDELFIEIKNIIPDFKLLSLELADYSLGLQTINKQCNLNMNSIKQYQSSIKE